ncbi:MAG TPA: KpsF/GutQ family sugar-phosphate isomerase [Gemmatimonadaceae bacterium]|nr:KpsF/GutQ family sugar-phosphate isomerase [Gemmatimonadaceae bacterium]
MTPEEIIERGRRVMRLERAGLAEAEARIGDSFAHAVQLIAASKGRVIVAGVGKSGLVGRKIAATMTSTGTPATFLHPTESVHGDLGIVSADDIALLISKSGETDELLPLLEQLKRLGVKTIALTGYGASTLARHSDVWLDASVREEACPHDLAPTTSTTVTLALGDALAVTLLEQKGFRREDFARLHPGGALGKKLLLTVSEVMLTENLPILPLTATMREAVVQLGERRGIAIIASVAGELAGIVTTGDFTRFMENQTDLTARVDTVMVRSPRTAMANELASAVVYRMEQHGIMAMPVLDERRHVVGVVHLHDLMRAGAAS